MINFYFWKKKITKLDIFAREAQWAFESIIKKGTFLANPKMFLTVKFIQRSRKEIRVRKISFPNTYNTIKRKRISFFFSSSLQTSKKNPSKSQ